jgi:glycosyltransferase involved in cell wall biosynthesis
MAAHERPSTPTGSDAQKFSIFHDGNEAALRRWHAPYADAFRGAVRVADVGCGPGYFLDLLRERALTGFGIDIDPDMVAAARRRGPEAIAGDHLTLATMPAAFGGVHLSHVIEHVWGDEAVALLEASKAALTPGGILIVRTPNWGNAEVRHGGFWLDHTHKRPYPRELLEKLLADLGFTVVQSGYEPSGWQDTYVVAQLPVAAVKPAPMAAAQPPAEPAPTVPPSPAPAFEPAAARTTILWRGDFLPNHSFARVNRQLARAMVATGAVDVIPQGEPSTNVEASIGVPPRRLEDARAGLPEVHLKHQWPPAFLRPRSGHYVHIQPYEFGAVPKHWVRDMLRLVDDVWCPTTYVQKMFTAAGIPPERTFVQPWGIDPAVYHPGVTPWDFQSPGTFVFLFVGGTIARKGTDLLLDAYLKTFTRNDNVALVFKAYGNATFYANQNQSDEIVALTKRMDLPIVGYNDSDLSDDEMAQLYRGADVLVLPYRGEGFGLPVIEAMACGTPAIVSTGGATDDFVGDDIGYRLPSRRVRTGSVISGDELAQPGWMLEVDVATLGRYLRYAYENRDEVRARGAKAARFVHDNYTWAHVARRAVARIDELTARPPVNRPANEYEAINVYEGNVFSAHGEDGILLEIFGRLRVTDPAFAEISTTASNVGLLIRMSRWRGVIVTTDEARAAELRAAYAAFPDVRIVAQTPTRANLTDLFATNGVRADVDLISIAAPGDDFDFRQALQHYRPRVIAAALGGNGGDAGAGLAAFSALGTERGYALLGVDRSGATAFFIRNDLLALCGLPDKTPAEAYRALASPGAAAAAR